MVNDGWDPIEKTKRKIKVFFVIKVQKVKRPYFNEILFFFNHWRRRQIDIFN